MMEKAIIVEIVWAEINAKESGKKEKKGVINLAKAGSPIQPSARLATVIPNWVAEIILSKSPRAFFNRGATLLPFLISSSTLVFLIDTNANSAATKKPFKKTSNKTNVNWIRNSTDTLYQTMEEANSGGLL